MKINDVKKLLIKTFCYHNLSRKHSKICAEALINAITASNGTRNPSIANPSIIISNTR